MLFLTKIWHVEAPIETARSKALCTPPDVEQCAPKIIGRVYCRRARLSTNLADGKRFALAKIARIAASV
jgi:hypothetical protein